MESDLGETGLKLEVGSVGIDKLTFGLGDDIDGQDSIQINGPVVGGETKDTFGLGGKIAFIADSGRKRQRRKIVGKIKITDTKEGAVLRSKVHYSEIGVGEGLRADGNEKIGTNGAANLSTGCFGFNHVLICGDGQSSI